MTISNRFFYPLAALCLVFFAFGMSALISRDVFERLPHLEDEVAYLYQAKIFARGQVVIETPQPRRAYWQPFVVDYSASGNRFGKYTPGWPLVLAAGVALGTPWVINAFLAAMTVALVYRLGGEIFGRDAGLIAAGLTAFSPMALLLNGTLMGHTAALWFAVLFMYAFWRMERGTAPRRWAIIAGLALGMVVISRPLTAIAIAAPFIVISGWRVLKGVRAAPPRLLWRPIAPYLIVALSAGLVSLAIPLFNTAATGDPSKNLYTLVWHYDRIGFGECCGRNVHRLEKAFNHTRFDLSLTAADLFGWQIEPVNNAMRDHWLNEANTYPATGLSHLILPLGVWVGVVAGGGWRRRWGLVAWAIAASGWYLWARALPSDTLARPDFSWLWVLVALGGVLSPLLLMDSPQQSRARWTWIMWSVVLGIVIIQMTYWIGSQRYSTRYYYEALASAAILGALPLAWLARRAKRRWMLYIPLVALLLYSLYAYSTPRISVLYRYNRVGGDVIAEVDARRNGQPALVIINGPGSGDNQVRWRAMGSLMAITSPFLDSEVVVAWAYAEGVREQILERFPDRFIIEMGATGNEAWFLD